ncbi:MAG: hypothetical protein IKP28_03765 [Clostridia bacterium]|nr:hypothetical protein [Clostridia bacterium]
MLARDIKKRQLFQQRRFIQKGLDRTVTRKGDGDCSYLYIGHLYPENVEYFRKEGFSICLIESETLKGKTLGIPVFLFTVASDVRLTPEEMTESERMAKTPADEFDEDEGKCIPKWGLDLIRDIAALNDDGR